jgi:hypothetical protein
MAERNQLDDAIDEAISALIDEETEGFHLVTTKDKGDHVGHTNTWYDGTAQIGVSDDLSIYNGTAMLYIHVSHYLNLLKDEHGEDVGLWDVFETLLAVYDETEMGEISQYERIGDFE